MSFEPNPMSMEIEPGSGALIGQTAHSNYKMSPEPWEVISVIWKAGRKKFKSQYWSVLEAVKVDSKRVGKFRLSPQAQEEIAVLNNGGVLMLQVMYEDGATGWLLAQLTNGGVVIA